MKYHFLGSRFAILSFLVIALLGLVPTHAYGYGYEGGQSMADKADDECDSAIGMTQAACGGSGMGGMNPAQQQQAQKLQNQSNQQGQNSQDNQAQAKACKTASMIGGIIGALSALKGGACLAAVANCREACGQQSHEETREQIDQIGPAMIEQSGDPGIALPERPRRKLSSQTGQTPHMKRMQKMCMAMAPGAGAAFAQAAAGMMSMLQSGQCDQQAATQQTPGPMAQQQNQMDCNNPQYAATNVQCICQKDPKNKMCNGLADMPSGLGYTAASGGPIGPSMGGLNGGISDGAPVMPFEGQAKPGTGSQEMGGGGGGGALGGGRGGAAGAGTGDGGGDGRSGVPTGIITGTAGGSGGAAGGSGTGGGGGGGRGGGGKDGRSKDGFNIKDFLPKAAGRNIAGMSISAKDGITGPLGPSIFEKVTKQYQYQRRNMIQDR